MGTRTEKRAGMMNPDGIAKRLKLAREMAGITQKQVGAMLGVHRVTVCHFETERRKPFVTQLLPLAKLLGVSVGWLVGETDPKFTLTDDRVKSADQGLAGLSDEDLDCLLNVVRALKRRSELPSDWS